MTNKEKCEAGIYDSVDVVIIRIKKILSGYKISRKRQATSNKRLDN